jgi:hypothetical protein
MIRWLALMALLPATLAAAPPPAGDRPTITGVSHLAVYSTDAAKTRDFYTLKTPPARATISVRASSSRCCPRRPVTGQACWRMSPTRRQMPRDCATGLQATA